MKKTISVNVKGQSESRDIEMQCCDRCGIGVGTTNYPEGKFKHINQKLHTTPKGREVCEDCLKDLGKAGK